MLAIRRIGLVLLLALNVTGCVTNPVTGASDFSLYGRDWEISTGAQQYGPSQQGQGGEYVVDAALSRYVTGVGRRLSEVSDNPLPYEFVVLNNSVPNAWALPGGKIAVNRGLLLELNNEAELAAVLGHEVVHAAARHGAQAMSRGLLLQGAMMVGAIATQDSHYSDYIVGASQLGGQLISQRHGREAERESDQYGIRYMMAAGYDPRAAVSLQETFVRLSEGRNQDWLSGLFSSHPPSEERVRNNQALVDEFEPIIDYSLLELGQDRYQQATAHIRETKPAYDAYDEAVGLVQQRKMDQALNTLDNAIGLEPREALFYGLQGDILLYEGEYEQALYSYDQAVSLHSDYFDYYLGRGVTYSRLGNRPEARSNLEQSANLLPTEVAMNELGKLSLADNNREQARQYFRRAASGQGQAAEEARMSYVRLDIEDNPSNYVQVEAYVGAKNQIMARVTNPLNMTLANINVVIELTVNGRSSRVNRRLGILSASSSTSLASGLAMPENYNTETDAVRVSILSAQILQ